MVRVMMVMVVEMVKEGWMSKVVLEVVVHHGGSHRGEMLEVVMVRGHVGQNWHKRGRDAHRWGHGEHVHMYPRCLPHASRRWPGFLPQTVRVIQISIVHLEVVELPVEDGDAKGHRACRKQHLHARDAKRWGIIDHHSPKAEVNEVVPAVVPGQTISAQACPERSVRVLQACDGVRQRLHQTTGTSPEG